MDHVMLSILARDPEEDCYHDDGPRDALYPCPRPRRLHPHPPGEPIINYKSIVIMTMDHVMLSILAHDPEGYILILQVGQS
eukprot:9299191-Pyramimonas_sp.AAC.1